MTKPKTEIWWTPLRYSGGRKSEIKPYLTEPFDGQDMLESMAELSRRLGMMNELLPADRAPSDPRWKLRQFTDKDRDSPDGLKIDIGVLLVSDRFKRAVKAAKLRTPAFVFKSCQMASQ